MSHDEHYDEEQDRPRIKVTDRRLFDRDGNPRDPDPEPAASSVSSTAEVELGAEAPEARPAGPAASAGVPDAPSDGGRAPSGGAGPSTGKAAPSGGKAASGSPPLKVSAEALFQFVEEQYMMGMIALGAMPHPQTGEPAEDPDMAQLRIEMLEALDERTRGTRGEQESQILEDALYRMRMVYLQKRKVAKL